MKLITLAAACAALVTASAAAPAFAASEAVVAKLAQPVAQSTKLIAGEAVFYCSGETCVANTPTSQTFSSSTCKTIAAKFGQVVSYTGEKAMDDARLASCNSAAAGQQVAKK